jgi:hypothetical protein
MTMKLVLHVGLQKTATSTLQRAVFTQHSDIFYLGKDRRSAVDKGCRNREVYDLLTPAIWNKGRTFDVERLRKGVNELIAPGAGEKVVTIGSWDALGNISTRGFTEMLRRLAVLFGDVRVVICLRKPVNWLQSLYLQELKGQFRKRNRRHLGFNTYVEFEKWLELKGGWTSEPGGMLRYGDNIRAASELLGKDRVGVFVFEELLADPAAYYTGICEFLGIDVDEALRLSHGKVFNRSLSHTQLQLLRETQSSLLKRFFWLIGPRSDRARVLDDLAGIDAEKVKVQMSPSTVAEIEDYVRGTNRWLAAEFGLPLENYGYPL